MAGASGRRESRERIKAEAQAKRDAVPFLKSGMVRKVLPIKLEITLKKT